MHNSFKTFIQRPSVQYVLELTAMTFVVLVYCFRPGIAYNEMDIIPYAKSVYDPSWLQNDWYLSLKIPYRYLFSYVVGFFIAQFGVVKTVFFGRLLTYVLFSFALLRLLKVVPLCRVLRILLLTVFLQLFQYGIGDVGEWMIGGLDTKVFAYSFALLSLAFFIQNKYRWGLFFSGLALSFHLLVGGYNLICLVPIILAQQFKSKMFILDLLKSSYLFLISGAVGLFAIFSQFSSKADKILASEGWNIYVNIRVPHHVIPDFEARSILVMVLFAVINMLFLKSKSTAYKSLAMYSLASLFIMLMGLFVYYFLDHQLLKYYFFRTSNVVLPLVTLILVFSFLYERYGRSFSESTRPTLIASVFILGLLGSHYKTIGAIITSTNQDAKTVLNRNSEDAVLMNWIRNNTDENAVFLVPPYFEYFYLNAERAVLVTWKNSPQGALDILEWYTRLKVINGNQDFTDLAKLNHTYFRLEEDDILKICAAYPEIEYVVLSAKTTMHIPPLYKTAKFAVYSKESFRSE